MFYKCLENDQVRINRELQEKVCVIKQNILEIYKRHEKLLRSCKSRK